MTSYEQRLSRYLSDFVTEKRLATMKRVLSQRTRYLSVAVEDIYQPHNGSAVLRTCDALGIQDVHIIENRNTYRVNPGVELGTAQWLTLTKYRDTDDATRKAFHQLRERGYRIVATTPHERDVTLDQFDLSAGKAVLVFGNELDGISRSAQEHADEFVTIPMYGFVESFNISVSAAIVLFRLTETLRNGSIPWQLDDEEQRQILLTWLRATVTKAGALEEKFQREHKE